MGFQKIERDKKLGLIFEGDHTVVWPCIYDEINIHYRDSWSAHIMVKINNSWEALWVRFSSDGCDIKKDCRYQYNYQSSSYDDYQFLSDCCLILKKGDKWGFHYYIDNNCIFLYDEILSEEYPFFLIKKNKNWGFALKTGDVVIPCDYDKITINDFWAKVKKGKQFGAYDITRSRLHRGIIPLVKCEYDDIYYTKLGLIFDRDGKIGLIRSSGDFPCEYQEIEEFGYFAFLKIKKDGYFGLSSYNVNMILLQCEYDEITLINDDTVHAFKLGKLETYRLNRNRLELVE